MPRRAVTRRLITKKEAAARIGRHPEHVMRLVRAGRFPAPVGASRLGRKHFVEDEVAAWIERQIAERDRRLAKEAGSK